MRSSYQRTVEELEKVASKFWPDELAQKEAELSIIPKLLETQDNFISILRTRLKIKSQNGDETTHSRTLRTCF